MINRVNNGAARRIVALGASAGGLEAVKKVISNLPTSTGMAFIIVQHVGNESLMAEIISKFTAMPVHAITDGMFVEPNHVYVNLPETDVSLFSDVLRVHPRQRQRGKPRRCIDYFMRSLAEHRGSDAIGVVLSGTLQDGSEGIKAIKKAFGITFAQDESAEWKGMPENAIATGCVDFVRPPEVIAEELARIGSDRMVLS